MSRSKPADIARHSSFTLAVILLVVAVLLCGIGILCLTGQDYQLNCARIDKCKSQISLCESRITTNEALAGTLTDDFAEQMRLSRIRQAKRDLPAWQEELAFYQRSVTLYRFGAAALFLGSLFLIFVGGRIILKVRKAPTAPQPDEAPAEPAE